MSAPLIALDKKYERAPPVSHATSLLARNPGRDEACTRMLRHGGSGLISLFTVDPAAWRAGAVVALWLALCCGLLAPAATAAPMRNVLILFSNNRLLPANIEADRGFREAIASSADRNVALYGEFLDRPAFSGPAFEQTMVTYLREKYASRKPEVIVAAGWPALDFVVRHRARVFVDVPVVHLGIGQARLKSMSPLPADVVGAPVVYDFAATIRQALHWHPKTRRLVLVTGASDGDREWEAQLRAQLSELGPGPETEYLAGLPTDAVLKRLAELGDGDLVFTPGYDRDGAGRESAPVEAVTRMAAASGAPVYGPFSTFIGTGVVGGLMPTFVEMGRQAARDTNGLLDGRPAAVSGPATVIAAQVQVDWRQVRKWGIAEDSIPADAITHFREPTFWEANRGKALIVAAVILVQALLIGALLIERRRRRRTASALEQSEARLSLAARAARLSIWIWDVTRDRLWSTSQVPQPAGVSEPPTVGFGQVLDSVHPADREGFERAVRRAVANDEELDVEVRMLQPSGELRWIAARGRPENGGVKRLTGVALDISARKAAELQAEKDRAALTHMTRVSMLGQLSASIAHQLNQPLAAILGNAEAARKMLEKEALDLVELRAICDDIISEDMRAAEVIRRLGALFKRGEVAFAPLDLNELVAETLDLVRTELLTRQVAIVTELEPSLPAVDAGRVQLQQVLLNLILNAADAMGDTDSAARTVTVRTEAQGPNVRLCVVDRGTGIASTDLGKVFDPFWTTKVGGTGIGLAICQSIIRAHQGTLTVSNNPEGGSTFCVRWPVRQLG
jgi:C4-dicarboxylate-specific signal transduction histidine kinase